MKHFSWKQYKENRKAAVENRNNTNWWTRLHPVKATASFWSWIKSVFRCYFARTPKVDEITFEDL